VWRARRRVDESYLGASHGGMSKFDLPALGCELRLEGLERLLRHELLEKQILANHTRNSR
jgi:hypothetical protein